MSTSAVLRQELSADGEKFLSETLPALQELGIPSDANERAEQVSATTGEGLMDLLRRVHTVIAPELSHDAYEDAMAVTDQDGSNRRELMQPEERPGFLDHAAELIRSLGASRHGADDNEAFLRRAGNVAGMAIVLAHVFEDANGRSARTLSQIIRYGIDPQNSESTEDLRVLSANRDTNPGYRTYSYLPSKEGIHMSPVQLVEVAASVEIPLSDDIAYQSKKYDVMVTPYSD